MLSACNTSMNNFNSTGQLTPYRTETSLPEAIVQLTPTPLPFPTPTPTIYVVGAGETISAIALRYQVDIAAILAANPQVNPSAMSVGTKLIIPLSSGNGQTINSTPVPLRVVALNCLLLRDGGVQCFLLVKNDQSLPVESIYAHIILGNSQGGQLMDQTGTSPVDILYPGQSMPITAYFQGPVTTPFQTSYQIISGLEVQDGNARYLDTNVENQQIKISSDGLSMVVNGQIALKDVNKKASKIMLAGVAYDAKDQVVGVRRWESPNLLPAGQKISFSIQVYSVGASISRVEVLTESRP